MLTCVLMCGTLKANSRKEVLNTMFKITLKAARINANMRQTDAAIEVGVSRDTIRNWETGRSSPKVDQLCKLEQL